MHTLHYIRLYYVKSFYVHDCFITEDLTASASGMDDKHFNKSNNSFKIGNIEVKLSEGDLTKETTDAIVNSTNERLDLSIGIVLFIGIYSKCNYINFFKLKCDWFYYYYYYCYFNHYSYHYNYCNYFKFNSICHIFKL